MNTIPIETSDGPMPAAVAEPDGTPKGAVVVLQEAFGLNGHVESLVSRLAEDGWLAVAPALYHRQGSPVFTYDDFDGLRPAMEQLTPTGVTDDLHATLMWVAAQGIPAARTGVVGFCMGGTLALHTGVLHPVGAAVTFYGGGVADRRFGLDPSIEVAPKLQAPWLGLYGDLDRGIPTELVEALRTAASRAPVATEVVRYADATHGFNCDERDSFHPVVAADAWARMLDWFDRHLRA